VETAKKSSAATHLSFHGPDVDGSRIEAWKDDALLGKIERGSGLGDGFRCAGGALRVALPVYAEAAAGAFFEALRASDLMRGDDDSLIVKASNRGVGLGFYVLPMGMLFERWSRYPEAGSSDPGTGGQPQSGWTLGANRTPRLSAKPGPGSRG
jgi:hypothetical protein